MTVPKSRWKHSLRLTEIDAAHEWGVKPSDLGLCSKEDDVSMMVAYMMTIRKMSAWERHQAQKEVKKQRARHRRR